MADVQQMAPKLLGTLSHWHSRLNNGWWNGSSYCLLQSHIFSHITLSLISVLDNISSSLSLRLKSQSSDVSLEPE